MIPHLPVRDECLLMRLEALGLVPEHSCGILPLDELVWWMRVQGVYARSIGESFAKAANDTALQSQTGKVFDRAVSS